jgi:hypothetical protein
VEKELKITTPKEKNKRKKTDFLFNNASLNQEIPAVIWVEKNKAVQQLFSKYLNFTRE